MATTPEYVHYREQSIHVLMKRRESGKYLGVHAFDDKQRAIVAFNRECALQPPVPTDDDFPVYLCEIPLETTLAMTSFTVPGEPITSLPSKKGVAWETVINWDGESVVALIENLIEVLGGDNYDGPRLKEEPEGHE